MADSGNDGLLGRLAVHFKMLTKEQLVEVTAQRGRLKEPVPLEQTLLAMELISQPQLVSLLKARAQYLEHQREKAAEAATPAAQAVPTTPTQQDRVSEPSPDAASVPTNAVVADDEAVVNDDAIANDDAFPAAQQSPARTSLATSLAAVVSQLLLPTADGKGRCAAYEILLRTPALPNVIRTGNTPMLTSLIQGGRTLGMRMMDDSLLNLVREGRITAEEAMRKAVDKTPFERLGTSQGSPDAGT